MALVGQPGMNRYDIGLAEHSFRRAEPRRGRIALEVRVEGYHIAAEGLQIPADQLRYRPVTDQPNSLLVKFGDGVAIGKRPCPDLALELRMRARDIPDFSQDHPHSTFGDGPCIPAR